MKLNFPLLMEPCYKTMPWGGTNLNRCYGKRSPYELTGESWEAAEHKNGCSRVSGGNCDGMSIGELTDKFGSDLLGTATVKRDFPILFKLIDARDKLSVQVHPTDAYAAADGDNGKTEMWTVLSAEPGAGLYLGFDNPTDKAGFEHAIRTNTLDKILKFIPVTAGDSFFLQAGLVHAIGGGLVIAEVQQSSDATYRVYDWGRMGLDGKPRPLHIQKALDVTDTSLAGSKCDPVKLSDSVELIAACDIFATERITLSAKEIVCDTHRESFHVVFCSEGNATLTAGDVSIELSKGSTALVPAAAECYMLCGNAVLCRYRVPVYSSECEAVQKVFRSCTK